MNLTEKITENEERLIVSTDIDNIIAREIVKLLRQKGVSNAQAERILKEADRQVRKVPLIDIGEEPFVPTDSSGTKYPVGGIAIPRPSDIHEHNQ